MPKQLSMEEQADALEHQQIAELGKKAIGKSLFYFLSDGERTLGDGFKPVSYTHLTLPTTPYV